MKKFGRILSLMVILVLVLTSCFMVSAFADTETESQGTFKLEKSYPEDGAEGTAVENVGVKLYFNKAMTSEKLGEVNADKFQLVDPDNVKLPIKVLYAPKEDGVVLVLLDSENMPEGVKIQSPGTYRLIISKDVVDDAGDTLGYDKTISFTTQNQKRNGLVNTLLMVFMMGGMMIFTIKGQKKQDKEDEKKKAQQNAPVNPYKEAKKTGKSVSEIVQKDQQRKDKEKAKEDKEKAKEQALYREYGLADDDELLQNYLEENHYRVGKPRTIASAGSTYITGRKAKYEAMMERKAKEAKWAAEAKKKGKGKRK